MTKVRARDRVEARFGAMGREARVVVIGGPARIDERARHLIEVLERKWSRYRSGSEVARVNAAAGRAVVVSPETYGLVARAVGAWRVTGGRFDPGVLVGPGRDDPDRAPDCGTIELASAHRTVRVPVGLHLDVRGLGRGFAADLAVADLLAGGASGALVGIGPDIRVGGEPPRPEGWFVDVEDPIAPGPLGRLRLRDGAVCTVRPDPRPGRAVVAASVVAGEAWWAHAVAAVVAATGPDLGFRVLARHGLTGLVVRADGEVLEAPGLAAFC